MQADKSVKVKIKQALHLGRALRLVWESAPAWTCANTALVIVQSLLPLASLYLMKMIVNGVTEGAAFANVALFIGLAGATALTVALLRSIASLVNAAHGQAVTDHVQDILHEKSIEVDLEYYENSQYFDKLHRAQQEAPYRPTLMANGLFSIGRSSISLLAIGGLLLFSLHWIFIAVLLASVLPAVLIRLIYANRMYSWQRKRTSTERRILYLNWLLTGSWHAKELRIFDLGGILKHRSSRLRRLLRREKLKIASRRSIVELIAHTGQVAAMFGSFAFLAYRTVEGSIGLGDLVMYYQAIQRGQGFLQEVLTGLAGLYENNLFLTSLYEFLDLKPKVIDSSQPRAVPRPFESGISFERLSFQYPTGTQRVLEDINLSVGPGEMVALVGENGAGKTTLIKLLCRFYDPTEGNITLDGIDLRDFRTSELRRQITVIFQDYAQYFFSARENIWFGNIEQPPDNEKIVRAARLSGADGFLSSLPKGYKTILGKWFEKGEELSTGQWKKVALARALLREAPIIILDEPTSGMDPGSESRLIERFRELAKDRSIFLVSHRMSTVRTADRIYMMKDGRIAESGSHEELIDRGGDYARMFEFQARYFR